MLPTSSRNPWVSALLWAALTVLFTSTASTADPATDWPQLRGPARDGIAPGPIAPSWPDGGPAPRWRRPIGEGFAGVAIVGDGLFTAFAIGAREVLVRYDTADGEIVWITPIGDRFEDQWGDGPRATPTVAGDSVYALASHGGLYAANAEDGSIRWSVDLTSLSDAKTPEFGFSPSPLVVDDLVIVEAGGTGDAGRIVAFAIADGRVRWRADTGRAGYSSPVVLGAGAHRQLIFLTRERVLALAPDGEALWHWPFDGGSAFDLPIAMPVLTERGEVFVSHRAEGGSALLEAARGTDGRYTVAPRWQNAFMLHHLNAGVVIGRTLYGFHNATLKAISLEDASLGWAQRGLGKGSLIAIGDRLVVLGDRGTLVLVGAEPTRYEEYGRFQAVSGLTWTSPSFANGVLYLRSTEELAAFDLRPPATTTGASEATR